MIDIPSINKTSPAPSSPTMSSQTPVAQNYKTFDYRHDNRLFTARYHFLLNSPLTHFDHFVAMIFVASVPADHQIPIAPRLC
jgi:hypothetical protein